MKKVFITLFLFFSTVTSVFSADYVIAAEKFEYTKGQVSNSVTDSTAELIPQEILSNINSQLMRSVLPDEQLERSRYKARQERYSLYLQLSSEYKKRDNLVLENYSDSELKKQISTQNKKIEEIEAKIQENLDSQSKAEQELEEKLAVFTNGTYTLENTDKTELEKYSSLFKNLFVKDESLVSIEGIKFYKNDRTVLFKPSDDVKNAGYTSPVFEKEVINASINALITGKITSYGEYCFVTLQVYSYPGANLIGTVTEVGSKNELKNLCSNIARQLIPTLTNSMKCSVEFKIQPENVTYEVFIDDSLQGKVSDKLILDSGVHRIQVVAEGYKTVSTNYYFEGNEAFEIQVQLEEEEFGNLRLTLLNPVPGSIYANSILGVETEDRISEIKINGSSVLGTFINKDGLASFYYIPKEKMTYNELFYLNATVTDKDKYIDTRRKWMYAGYSAFMISLIPTFFTNGERQKYANMYHQKHVSYDEAKTWENIWLGCCAVSITAGIFWGVELVRYLVAANSVIPETPKIDKDGKLAKKQQKNIQKAEKKQKQSQIETVTEDEILNHEVESVEETLDLESETIEEDSIINIEEVDE